MRTRRVTARKRQQRPNKWNEEKYEALRALQESLDRRQ